MYGLRKFLLIDSKAILDSLIRKIMIEIIRHAIGNDSLILEVIQNVDINLVMIIDGVFINLIGLFQRNSILSSLF